MSKSTYQNMLAQQRRITKRTNLFISHHNKLVNIGMVVFFLLLLFVATGLPSKITRSIHGSKPTNTISSSADNSITISPNKDNSVINIKTPASTATPAAAPPTPTNQPSYNNPNSSTNYKSDYIAPVCTRTVLPYSTSYQDVSYMDVGQTSSLGGTDGWTQTCTADSTGWKPTDITYSPYNKVVYVGTRQPATVPTPTYSPSPNYAAKSTCDYQYQGFLNALGNTGAGSSSAVQMGAYAYSQCLRNAGF